MGSWVGCRFWDDLRVTGVAVGETVGQYERLVIAETVPGTDALRVKGRVLVCGNAVALSRISKQPLAHMRLENQV